MDKIQVGWNRIEEIAGEQGVKTMEEVQDFSPRLAKMAVEFGYGDIYSDDTLDLKQRAMITLSSLISQGDQGTALTFHFKIALKVGLSKEEILEVINHCSGYVGFPKAISSLSHFKKAYSEFENENK
ncbi:4-carboxymuconolactone decarboxylase [Gracilibacillus orientalis]|uniref:4-carboxymuconolactone decarboxylase n=1 Tax=Gracilibacillus orientalis TaxID=334253 RepID=A0A1I4L604_9BACI|nr:carboxymuconolactone decarboxylase family protein [Gracilibacillus orientalis]SFL86434.1 4-carboxymuconolactone decarboxylase [Gracilibacillus orientalis]